MYEPAFYIDKKNKEADNPQVSVAFELNVKESREKNNASSDATKSECNYQGSNAFPLIKKDFLRQEKNFLHS